MSNNNLELWNKVCETDPDYTKKVNQRGGYTAIDPAYQAKKATEQFGAYGMGWGLSETQFDYTMLESHGMVILKAIFFYVSEGKRNQFPIHNAVSVGKVDRPDVDFAKKLETNTLSKALSRLGFSADVFMGQFDDTFYMEQISNKKALEQADNKADEEIRQQAEYDEWLNKQLSLLSSAQTMNELQIVYKSVIRKMKMRDDETGVIRATKVKDDRKLALSEKEGEQ